MLGMDKLTSAVISVVLAAAAMGLLPKLVVGVHMAQARLIQEAKASGLGTTTASTVAELTRFGPRIAFAEPMHGRVSKERSRIMSRVRGKHTVPELTLRQARSALE